MYKTSSGLPAEKPRSIFLDHKGNIHLKYPSGASALLVGITPVKFTDISDRISTVGHAKVMDLKAKLTVRFREVHVVQAPVPKSETSLKAKLDEMFEREEWNPEWVAQIGEALKEMEDC